MRIRNRLLVLLLGIALLPLLGTALLHQGSVRLLRQRLTTRTMESLDATAREVLLSLLESNTGKFERDGRLNYQAIQRQALEIEMRLADNPTPYGEPGISGEFGRDTRLTEPNSAPPRPPGSPSSAIHFQEQRYSLSPGTHPADIRQDLARLSGMTSVYHDIYANGASGILWLYTSLENGLHTGYPISDGLRLDPNVYDPRQRPWYQDTVKTQGLTRTPLTDATTGSAIVTLARPVYRPDGSLAGVTAIDRSISTMLSDFALPARWDFATKKRIVEVIPETADHAGRLRIVLWNDEGQPQENLISPDRIQLQKLMTDLQAGKPGTQRMSYRGEDSLWVYQNIDLGRLAIVLIIPYTRIHDLALEEETIIDREIVSLLTLTGIGLAAAIAMAVFLAFNRSAQITRPISELTQASHRLIGGDYHVRVDIDTGDELEQLGDVFNQTGPALEERAQIKQSLELAGAIQQNLLPRTAPQVRGFDLAARCLYCDETGGDYYDFIDLRSTDSKLVGLAVGDVTGHGVGAALLMASIRSILHAESRHYRDDLVGLFTTMNNQIARDTDPDKFITLFYGLLNEADRSLIWVSAGHDPALHFQADTGQIVEHSNTGMLMGLLEDVPYTQAGPVDLAPGDILLVGTDGIWEAQNPQGAYFGRERLFDIVRNSASQSADQLAETVLSRVTSFVATGLRRDDITLLVVKGE
jgi:sigma-B regulation protein RsbU (phosphoserine phosphatase)